MERVSKITDGTLVPLGLVITLAGGIAWLTTIYAKTEAHGASIDRLSTVIESIDQRLAHIEGMLQKGNR